MIDLGNLAGLHLVPELIVIQYGVGEPKTTAASSDRTKDADMPKRKCHFISRTVFRAHNYKHIQSVGFGMCGKAIYINGAITNCVCVCAST